LENPSFERRIRWRRPVRLERVVVLQSVPDHLLKGGGQALNLGLGERVDVFDHEVEAKSKERMNTEGKF
jgi:hypothetical protein